MSKLQVDELSRLTLEDYIVFFTTRTGHGVTMEHLKQIAFMHGFRKLGDRNKPVVVDALNSIDLMRPRRSTVSIYGVAPPPGAASASSAALSKEDVTDAIEDLGWHECPIGSLLSIRAGAAAAFPVPLTTILPGSGTEERVSRPSVLSASSPPRPCAQELAAKRKPRGQGRKAMVKKRKRVAELLALPSLEDMAIAA